MCGMDRLNQLDEWMKGTIVTYGIDYSDYAVENADPIARPYCVQGSLADPVPKSLDRKYDLVTCFEVLEHMSEEDGKKAIENLTKLSDTIAPGHIYDSWFSVSISAWRYHKKSSSSDWIGTDDPGL